jgi:hypothetical protein
MKNGSTLFLKIAVILLGIPVLALCIFLVPKIAHYMVVMYPEMPILQYLVYIGLYITAIPFYYALYQSFKLLNYIDNNNAFSDLSVTALKTIKKCAVIISVIYVLDLPLFYLFAERDDSPGVIIVGLLIIFASLVIAFFAALLQKLLQEAINIKSENDLTV